MGTWARANVAGLIIKNLSVGFKEIPVSEAPKSIHTQFHEAIEAIEETNAALARMRALVSNARINEAHALNRVNEEQGKFDALVARMKKAAQQDTKWKSVGGVPPWGSN